MRNVRLLNVARPRAHRCNGPCSAQAGCDVTGMCATDPVTCRTPEEREGAVSAAPHILLINPTIASPRSTRFPLAVLNLAASLGGKYSSTIVDGNVDRDFVSSTLRTIAERRVAAVGVSVMGGPQLLTAIAVSKAIRARFAATPIVWGGHFPTICVAAN